VVPEIVPEPDTKPERPYTRLALNEVYSVNFAIGSAAVSRQYRELLRDIVALMEAHPGSKLYLSGHTDATGRDEFNQRLSLWRAQNVELFLKEVGLPANRVQILPLGADEPVAGNDDESGRALNRRVELIVRPAGGPASFD
jgi:outer membrane protein OmpA-like peptidoglycan-associated protein